MTLDSSRRIFLKSSALAGVVFGAAPRSLMRSVFAAEGRSGRKTFVVVFQRGACDGLNTVIPWGDPGYRKARPSIAIAAPLVLPEKPAMPASVVTTPPGVIDRIVWFDESAT